MLVELNRENLANLLASTNLPLDWSEEFMELNLGWFDEVFWWDRQAIVDSKLTDEELFELYKRIMNFWNNVFS